MSRWPVRIGCGAALCALAAGGASAVTPRLSGAGAQAPPIPRVSVPRPGNGPARPGPQVPGGHLLKMSYSTVVELAYRGIDVGHDEGGIGDAFPGTGVPRLPGGFAPNVIVNQDRSAAPHNETSVAINPASPNNVLIGENDYEIGFGTSGVQASFDAGQHFYGAVLPFPSVYFSPPLGPRTLQVVDGGGDPSVAFDRDGVAYYADLNFHREGCISGVFVSRSTNGGQTWSRPLFGTPNPGDTRRNGDGVVAVNADDNDCSVFFDKEMIAAGPRPAGVAADGKADPAHRSRDRLYATFTEFGQVPPIGVGSLIGPLLTTGSPIFLAYSDDQGRDWSKPVYIGGRDASLCGSGLGLFPGPVGPNYCVDSQGSEPVVDPATGDVYVSFFNSDNANCPSGQVLVVRSHDGGRTFSHPTQAACPHDDLPTASAVVCPDATAGDALISGLCFRVPPETQQSIALNPRDHSVHVTYVDNRNGGTDWNPRSTGRSDLDVYTTGSSDRALTWSQPVRVNQDPLKDKRDQFFPWSTFGDDGTFFVSFLDRSLDNAGARYGESLARSHDDGKTFVETTLSTGLSDGNVAFRKGIFLGDYTGVAARGGTGFAAWPDTRRSGQPVAGGNPTNFWSDIAGSGLGG